MKKEKTKSYDIVLETWLYFGIGCALDEPPLRTINEIVRANNHCWEATKDAINLLESLGLIQNVRGKYQYVKRGSGGIFQVTNTP